MPCTGFPLPCLYMSVHCSQPFPLHFKSQLHPELSYFEMRITSFFLLFFGALLCLYCSMVCFSACKLPLQKPYGESRNQGRQGNHHSYQPPHKQLKQIFPVIERRGRIIHHPFFSDRVHLQRQDLRPAPGYLQTGGARQYASQQQCQDSDK